MLEHGFAQRCIADDAVANGIAYVYAAGRAAQQLHSLASNAEDLPLMPHIDRDHCWLPQDDSPATNSHQGIHRS
ncbi:hypothetical protein SDC9_189417 [bioreactor metagenome]|uniref:Uncharacterized protein n=1 Tax=bioreactor metagenome TaxID=1076179 RepID=A0A645HTR7_9ZZZZ